MGVSELMANPFSGSNANYLYRRSDILSVIHNGKVLG